MFEPLRNTELNSNSYSLSGLCRILAEAVAEVIQRVTLVVQYPYHVAQACGSLLQVFFHTADILLLRRICLSQVSKNLHTIQTAANIIMQVGRYIFAYLLLPQYLADAYPVARICKTNT